MNDLSQSGSLLSSLPEETLYNQQAAAEALRVLADVRSREKLEYDREHADEVRARCQTFRGFAREAWPIIEPATRLRWNWHLDCITDHLEAISRGQLRPRIIFNVPPGCSKSTAVSVLWQAWEWGALGRLGMKFLSTSYELENVKRDTRKTRDLIMSEWYRMMWPDVQLTRAAELSFANTKTGTREGVAFSAITAKRGDRFTIDDPHSLDGAESEVERDKAVRRFMEGGQNRLNDQQTSALVIVMQRLHEADLTGAILARDIGYEHVMLPMEYEPERRCVTSLPFEDPRSYDGELLDPQRFPQAVLDELRIENDYMWAGQYQQRPAPREGGMFKVEKITGEDNALLVDHVPAGAVRVRGWDIAGSSRKKSPFTVGARLAWLDPILYIEDVVRERAEIEKAEALIEQTCFNDGKSVIESLPQDPGQAGKSQVRHLAARLAGLNFRFSPETGTKEDRAIPFAAMVNAGNVRMVKGPWNNALIDEMRNFPGSTFKDQVDALSRAFAEMAPFMRKKQRFPAGAIPIGAEAE